VVLATYGRAPLFFHVAHWYVLHVMALGATLWMGVSWREFDVARDFAGLPHSLDFTLPGVYPQPPAPWQFSTCRAAGSVN
jgi:hypothetical protein